MSAHTQFPTLFGRFTAILRDHDDLKKTLGKLQELCTELESPGPVVPEYLAPAQLLRLLESELREHFSAEESDSYFGTVEMEEPRLSNQVRELRGQHVQMLATIGVLTDLASNPAHWEHLAASLRNLIAEFELHERAESGLLNRFFRSHRAG